MRVPPRPSRTRRLRSVFPAAVSAALAVSTLSAPAAAAQEPVPAACPANLEDSATCYTGQSADGAYYAIAVP